MRAPYLPLALLGCLAVGACTAQQRYYSAQGWQRNECEKLLDKSEREQFLRTCSKSVASIPQRGEEQRIANPLGDKSPSGWLTGMYCST